MMIAMPFMKPVITGYGMYSMTRASRNAPKKIWKTPESATARKPKMIASPLVKPPTALQGRAAKLHGGDFGGEAALRADGRERARAFRRELVRTLRALERHALEDGLRRRGRRAPLREEAGPALGDHPACRRAE